MSLIQKMKHYFRGCLADKQINAIEVCTGVLDLTFECKCGKQWTRTFRTKNVDCADWFHRVARKYK